MSLEKELEGVTASDIPSPEDVNESDEQVDDLDTDAGDESDQDSDSDGDGADDKPGRTVENVRREVLRKLDESEKRNASLFGQMISLMKSMAESKSEGKKPGAKDVADMSSNELAALRDQVPEDKRAEFDALLVEKRIEERVDQRLTKFQEERKYRDERTRANQLAVERFPQLKDMTSQLALEVDRRLKDMPGEFKRYNTRIVLNTAEDVAAELGIRPRHSERARRVTHPASIGSNKPVKQETTEKTPSTDNLNKIAKSLSGGKIKFDEAAMKRIKERAKLYQQ